MNKRKIQESVMWTSIFWVSYSVVYLFITILSGDKFSLKVYILAGAFLFIIVVGPGFILDTKFIRKHLKNKPRKN